MIIELWGKIFATKWNHVWTPDFWNPNSIPCSPSRHKQVGHFGHQQSPKYIFDYYFLLQYIFNSYQKYILINYFCIQYSYHFRILKLGDIKSNFSFKFRMAGFRQPENITYLWLEGVVVKKFMLESIDLKFWHTDIAD